MDDLISGLVVVMLAAAAVFAYLVLAGAAAAALGLLAAVDAVGFMLWRLADILQTAVTTRGGDRRAAAPPEPAYEIYFGAPLWRDYRAAFGTAIGDVFSKAGERASAGRDRFTGYAVPLAIGVAIGAYLGALIGVVVGGLIAVPLGALVGATALVVAIASRCLQVLERGRRRVRGAHFDCPSCHRRAELPVYVCPGCGAKHRVLLPGRWGIRHRRCECDAVVLPVSEGGGRHKLTAECPWCSHIMPGAGGVVPEVAVPIVGGPKAGKTALLASILVELDKRSQAGEVRLSVVESSRQAFATFVDDLSAGRPPRKTQDQPTTPAFVAEVRAGGKRSTLLYVHDVAGERYQQADAVRDMDVLRRARGALIVIDPFSLRPLRASLDLSSDDAARLSPSDEDPQHVVERFVQGLREAHTRDVARLPVALVLTKADALPARGGPKPGASGEAVRSWFQGQGGGNLLRMMDAECGRVEFFAASALGRSPAPNDTESFLSFGTMAPLLWLLHAAGFAGEGASVVPETMTERLGSGEGGARRVSPRPREPLLAMRARSAGGTIASLAAAVALFVGLFGGVATLANGSQDSSGTSSDTGQSTAGPGPAGDAFDVNGVHLSRRTYGAFSILVPSGWNIVRREKDMGDFVETRWVSPHNTDVLALLDYTEGFSGTSRSGAEGVRKLVRRSREYEEYGFAATQLRGKPEWRWDFKLSGLRKSDYFAVQCGNEYAFLGQAPPDEFSGVSDLYDTMFRSLAPSC